jgi:two-component system, response regulator YesN
MPNKILLVDDDRDFRDEFREALNAYDIVEAGDGDEALKILNKPNDIDLVILDVKMPGIQGTEVLKEIKRIAPDLGIIILTAHSSEDVAIEALKGRADDYIEKPMDVGKTKEVIEGMLDQRAGVARVNGIAGKVEKAKCFMERNCYKKVSLEDAAGAVSLSPKYFSRIFKEETGKGFTEYRSGMRAREAKALLEKTGLNIDQIASKIGYKNTESFTRLFKSHTGMTPSGYRKRYSKKNKTKRPKGRCR